MIPWNCNTFLSHSLIHTSPALGLKGSFHFQMAQMSTCAVVMPLQTWTSLWTSLAHTLTRTVIFSPPSSPFITIPGRQVLLGKHFVMKLSPDLLFELVSVLPFNNNLFSAAKVEQLVSIINIMRFYCSNSLKSVCPVLLKYTGGHFVMKIAVVQATERNEQLKHS